MYKSLRRPLAAAMAFSLIGLSGCANSPSNRDLMSIFGGATGAVLGSQIGGGSGRTIMTVVGGVAGYVIGGNIGARLDAADQARAAQFANQRFNDPYPGTYQDNWQTRDRTPVQTVVVTQPVQTVYGRECREFTQETTVRINGRPEVAKQQGLACFEHTREYPHGIWVIQK